MKLFIITMEDPVYTLPFIKDIIDARAGDIAGVALAVKGNRLTIDKKKSKFAYLISLLLIMGVRYFAKYSFITFGYKIKKKLSKYFKFVADPSILGYANSKGIETFVIENPNKKDFIKMLEEKQVDVIINQSQCILKKKLLNTPSIGVINRHNALLPKNRGRLTPFWVLFNGEKETGVSIHFVESGIDSGEIIVQERFPLDKKDNFNSVVKKNYEVASKAMVKAIDILEKGNYQLIGNNDDVATYNSTPTFKEALRYRVSRIKRLWN